MAVSRPPIQKAAFSRPPYTNKWHFPDPLYNKIVDRRMRKLEISRPSYKNVSSRPPNTTKWHFLRPTLCKEMHLRDDTYYTSKWNFQDPT